MAYIDYGLGLGLAYRHDWAEADRFKLAATELGQREAERKYQREREVKIDEERNREKITQDKIRQAKYIGESLSMPEGIEGKYWLDKMSPKIKKELTDIADITNDPNWEQNPESYQRVQAAKMRIQNDPDVATLAQAKSKFDLANEDYENGRIRLDQFKEEEKKYNEFRDKGPNASGGVYDYQPAKVKLEDMFIDHFGKMKPDKNYFGSAAEMANIKEFYQVNRNSIDEYFNNLDPGTQQLFGGSAYEFTKKKSKYYTIGEQDKNVSTSGEGTTAKMTLTEKRLAEAAKNFKKDILDAKPKEGTVNPDNIYENTAVSALLPTNDAGYIENDQLVLFDQDATGKITAQPYDLPMEGARPIKRTIKRFRKHEGIVYIESLFQVPIYSEDIVPETKENWLGRERETGNDIIISEFYKNMKAKGAVTDERIKGDTPYIVVRAWAQADPSEKTILEYSNKRYGNDELFIPKGTDEEVPAMDEFSTTNETVINTTVEDKKKSEVINVLPEKIINEQSVKTESVKPNTNMSNNKIENSSENTYLKIPIIDGLTNGRIEGKRIVYDYTDNSGGKLILSEELSNEIINGKKTTSNSAKINKITPRKQSQIPIKKNITNKEKPIPIISKIEQEKMYNRYDWDQHPITIGSETINGVLVVVKNYPKWEKPKYFVKTKDDKGWPDWIEAKDDKEARKIAASIPESKK